MPRYYLLLSVSVSTEDEARTRKVINHEDYDGGNGDEDDPKVKRGLIRSRTEHFKPARTWNRRDQVC